MGTALKKIDRLLNWLQDWILVISGTAVCLMIMVNALCRFLRIDWFGSEELTLFVAFWLYFTGAACAAREKTHISADMMELFTTNQKIIGVIGVVKNIIALTMASMFTVWCFNYVKWQMHLGAKSSAYKLPVVIATIPILIGFALWTLYLVRDLAAIVREMRKADVNAETKEGE